MTTDARHLKGNWNYPTRVWFGCGRIKEMSVACTELKIKKPLLVTDQGLVALDMVKTQLADLQSAGLMVNVYSDVKPNPTGKNVDDGVKMYKAGGHDGVIAFGGGSSLDAGKAIALMAGQDRPLWDFEDVGDNWTRVKTTGVAPVIAVPTTAGTGSEVGRASVIHDVDAVLKKIIFHPLMLPRVVIADPELTVGLNARITAATGMDALSHNLEALCAPGYHPQAEGIAIEGMRLVKDHLVTAVKNPNDLVARSQMLSASLMGATAFQKGLGGMHALAHPLGATYDAHHGLLNAILMPYVLKYNADVIEQPMQRLANVLELQNKSVQGVVDWVLQLRKDIGIPHSLKEINIDDSRLSEIAKKAVEDPSNGGNPKSMQSRDYEIVLNDAINGRL
ncbi:MAG: iron-containing alcohol dehydrogenase [Gammaproteobacteria bacterium]|nr:iron-containing alcohol dehydrogenase [Gammaproteobacteria bacterium]